MVDGSSKPRLNNDRNVIWMTDSQYLVPIFILDYVKWRRPEEGGNTAYKNIDYCEYSLKSW